jgi:DNA-binding response OmpR family regulator
VSDEEEAQEEAKTGLVFIDPDEKSRHQAEALEEALSRSILAVDASEFKPADSEEIQQAAAFVVCWDLGFQTGGEMIEAIRSDETLRDRKVLVSMDAPTRRSVLVAMTLGADGVCLRPYDGDELMARLEQLGLPRPAPAE